MPLLFDYACWVSWIGPISCLTWVQVMTSNYGQKILLLTACNDTNLAMCFMTIPRKWFGFWILWEGRIDWLRLCIEKSGIWGKWKRPSRSQKRKICLLKFARSKLLANDKWECWHYHISRRGFFLKTIPPCLPSVVWNVGSLHGWAADDLREYTRCHHILFDSTISLYNSYS